MAIVQQQDLRWHQSNTFSFKFTVKDSNNAVVDITNDTVIVSFKARLDDVTPVLTKSIATHPQGALGIATVPILPAETSPLNETFYFYDGVLVRQNGDRHTIAYGNIELIRSVSP